MATQVTITGTIPSAAGVRTLGPLTFLGAANEQAESLIGTAGGGDTVVAVPATAKGMLVIPGGFSTSSPPTLNVRLTGQGAGTAIPLSVFGAALIPFDTPPASVTFNLSAAGPATSTIAVVFV